MNHRKMNINQVIKNTIVINYMVPNLKDTNNDNVDMYHKPLFN